MAETGPEGMTTEREHIEDTGRSELDRAIAAHAAWHRSDCPNLRDFYGRGPNDYEDYQWAVREWHAEGQRLWAEVERIAESEATFSTGTVSLASESSPTVKDQE